MFRPSRTSEHRDLKVLRLPKVLAARSREGLWNEAVLKLKSRLVEQHLGSVSGKRILYLWHPQLWDYSTHIATDARIYHVYDRPMFSDDASGRRGREQYERACREADIVICGTPQQAEEIPRDDVRVVPNGVDFKRFTEPYAAPRI